MAGTLHIYLLGGFRLVYDDVPLTNVDTARLKSLLAYLVLQRDAPQTRSHLSYLFWSDSTEAQARTNLRKQLYHLRHALPDTGYYLHIDGQTVQWQASDRFTLDVADLEQALDTSEQARQTGDAGAQRAALENAVELYAGDLLPDVYEDWVLEAREHLRARVLVALEQLAKLLENQRAYDQAIAYTQHLLRLDPLHEPAYHQLMRLLALQGKRAAAIRTYRTYASLLRQELDVAPSVETRQLYHDLLALDAAVSPPTSQSLASWPLVGRNSAWAQLQAAWSELEPGARRLVLLTGVTGIGKTRLAEEFAGWAKRQGIATAFARCYASGQGLAYRPVADWLRSPSLQPALEALDPVWLTEIARLVPEILVRQPGTPPPRPMTESWQRQHLFEAMAQPIDQQPRLLLVADDVQWADHETVEWLSYVLHRPSRGRRPLAFLLVATARAEELPDNQRLGVLVDELSRVDQMTSIELGPLTDAESLQLAAGVAGRPVDPGLAATLYRETEGNPLFVVETVRAALAGTEGARDDGQAAGGRTSLPPAVHSAVVSRLARLSPQARELASVAATLGRRFTFDVVAHAAADEDQPPPEEELVRALDELWQRHIVHQFSATDYDFTHDKIRHVVYQALSPLRRRHLHRRVARALAQAHSAEQDQVAAEIAWHYEQGGLEREASKCYHHAANVARRIYANEEAIGIYQHLLDSDLSAMLSDDEACTIMLELGETWQLTGHWPAAGQIYRQALARAELGASQEIHARCQLALGNLVRLQGAYDDALRWLSAARTGFEALQDGQQPSTMLQGLVRSLWAIGEVYWYKGDHTRAQEALERQMEIARALDDRRGMCDAAGTLGIVYWSRGEFERAREFSLQSLELAKSIDYWWGIGRALINLGNTHNNEGNLTPAFAAYEQAFEVCDQIGDRQCTAWALANLGHVYHLAGQDQAALTAYRLGLQSALEIGDRWAVSLALANLAKISASVGEIEQAEDLYHKSIDLAQALGANYLCDYQLSLAHFYEQQGRFEPAWQVNEQVLRLAGQQGSERMGGVDTLFSAQLLAVKLRYALGHARRPKAMNDLEGLLGQAQNDVQRVLVRYEMWQLDPADDSLRRAAAELYASLDAARIRGDHRRRYRHATGEEPPPLPALPDLAEVVGQAIVLAPDWLAQVDEWLAATPALPQTG